jgi:hypothetical protein
MGFVRGTIILALALGLPAIAFFGLPREVRTWLDADFWPWNNAAMAPLDEHDHENANAMTELHSDEVGAVATPKPSFFARTDSIRADYQTAPGDEASRIALASAEARVLRQPVFRPSASDQQTEVVRHVPTDAGAGQGGAGDAAAVRAIEARLREFGALNYQLQQESGSGRYRFVCLCENARGERRTFEATSSDRLQAMQTVLGDVATWRNDISMFFGPRGR